MSHNVADLRRISQRVRAAGQSLQHSAGMDGEMGDRGGGTLIAQADAFDAGLDNVLPVAWQRYAEQDARETDPQWAKYQELKKHFGDK